MEVANSFCKIINHARSIESALMEKGRRRRAREGERAGGEERGGGRENTGRYSTRVLEFAGGGVGYSQTYVLPGFVPFGQLLCGWLLQSGRGKVDGPGRLRYNESL